MFSLLFGRPVTFQFVSLTTECASPSFVGGRRLRPTDGRSWLGQSWHGGQEAQSARVSWRLRYCLLFNYCCITWPSGYKFISYWNTVQTLNGQNTCDWASEQRLGVHFLHAQVLRSFSFWEVVVQILNLCTWGHRLLLFCACQFPLNPTTCYSESLGCLLWGSWRTWLEYKEAWYNCRK